MTGEAANTKGSLRGPHQSDSLGISANTNWTKLLLVGRGKISILQVSLKGTLHIRKKVKLVTFVNSALFRFTKQSCYEKYHSTMNYYSLYMQLPQYWVQEYHLYSKIVSKTKFRG